MGPARPSGQSIFGAVLARAGRRAGADRNSPHDSPTIRPRRRLGTALPHAVEPSRPHPLIDRFLFLGRIGVTLLTNRRLLTNAAVNTLGFLAQIAVSFVMAPLTIRALGDDRYGVWSFVESFLAYMMLFDLGIAA